MGDCGNIGSALPLYPEVPSYQTLEFLHELGFGFLGDSIIRDIVDDMARPIWGSNGITLFHSMTFDEVLGLRYLSYTHRQSAVGEVLPLIFTAQEPGHFAHEVHDKFGTETLFK
jgi:hypothetical protein